MKKLILIVIGIIVIIIGIIGVCKGFKIREDVVVSNYIFSADGKKVSFDATVTSTVGYVRKVKVNELLELYDYKAKDSENQNILEYNK